jgi:hypothetical protein
MRSNSPCRSNVFILTKKQIRDVTEIMRSSAMDLALTTNQPPREIWRSVSDEHVAKSDDEPKKVPSKEQILNLIKNTRSKELGNDIYQKIEIANYSCMSTADLRLFLQFHTVDALEGRLLRQAGWAHPELLSILFNMSLSLYVDGTFRSVPKPFSQCYITMVFDHHTDEYVPVYFVLLEAKSEWTYWTMLHNIICSTRLKMGVESVTMDFEKAAIQATRGTTFFIGY